MIAKLSRTALMLAALAAGVIGISTASATPAAAQAGISIQIGSGGVQFANHHGRSWQGQRHRGGRHHARPQSACSAQQAVQRASRLGMNRARVVRADRRGVVVQGRARGHIATAHFAQARGCPLISYR